MGFCHHDWLQMLLCSYTHTTASLVDIFLFFRSSCLYLDLCSMLVNLISSRSRDNSTSPGLKYIDQFGTCNVGPIHCARHSWWNPPLGFCHDDWLQMLLCSYTHTTASLVDIFLFFRSSCLYLDLCSMLVNLISSRSRDNNIWSHVSSRPHGGPDDGVDFSIGIDQKPSVCLCHIMSWNMLMTLKFHDIDQD